MPSATTSTLYLLAGNGSTVAWWQETLPHFHTYRPCPLELPGFGDNPSTRFASLAELAQALLDQTQEGQQIFAVGINSLVVLHALVRKPQHFRRVMLLAPVGAYLWERSFVKVMGFRPARKLAHWLLSYFPRLFRRNFTTRPWPREYYRRIAEGYRKCRAFETYFDIVQPHSALDLFEWITTPIDLFWGQADGVIGAHQSAAWDSILPRAPLTITVRSDWGHYPYFDDPAGFARDIEGFAGGSPAHTKAGRLKLAELAGLPVPPQVSVSRLEEVAAVLPRFRADQLLAVRSSGADEDHIDHSHAGRHHTFLRVRPADVAEKARVLLELHGLESVVIQRFIEPCVSGVAFCRWISLEIEYVAGHPERLVSGEVAPRRAIFCKMAGAWSLPPEPLAEFPQFDFDALEQFLRRCLRAFHYHPSDIEWAWDGHQFYLLQLRPVTSYAWRRCLTSANLDELLPRYVSRMMEYAQRRAALTISRIYALWDARVLNDHEPFTAVYLDASYINVDLFLSRMCDWGMPGQLMARAIGGAVPHLPARFGRMLRSLPTLFSMYWAVRREIVKVEPRLRAFEQQFSAILATKSLDQAGREAALTEWFVRYYVFIVQTNIIINACVTSAAGSFLGKAKTVYQEMGDGKSCHRLKHESDPATPRPDLDAPAIAPFPRWNPLVRLLNRMGAPGLAGRYFEIREWFRDNNMKLFFRLHHAMKGSAWLQPWSGARSRSGTFWQSGGSTLVQDFSFVIYPGTVTGTVGAEILIVDALEPGLYEEYTKAKAVIARTGGRLSHGATLLRELKKPSAILQNIPADLQGKTVTFDNGRLEIN
jgi:pimeloyl-ACP methyl ester carboxylesterase